MGFCFRPGFLPPNRNGQRSVRPLAENVDAGVITYRTPGLK
jgi:hypothetical protein